MPEASPVTPVATPAPAIVPPAPAEPAPGTKPAAADPAVTPPPAVLPAPTPAPEATADPAAPAPGAKPTALTPPAEYKLTMPEGFEADEKLLGEFTAMAQAANLSAEDASKFVAWQAEQKQAEVQAGADAWAEQQKTWATELKTDTEFGGEKHATTLANAQKAIRQFGGEGFANEFARMGLGDHPMLVKLLAKVGGAMAEDGSWTGGQPATGPKTKQQVISDFYKTTQGGR